MPATLRRVPEGTVPFSSAGVATGAIATMDTSATAAAAIESVAFLIRADFIQSLIWVGPAQFRRITIAEERTCRRGVAAAAKGRPKAKRRGPSLPLRPRRHSN